MHTTKCLGSSVDFPHTPPLTASFYIMLGKIYCYYCNSSSSFWLLLLPPLPPNNVGCIRTWINFFL